MFTKDRSLQLVPIERLRHIEDYGRKRVIWLKEKILSEGVWTVPLKIDDEYGLVMDGQHRMEVAKMLGLTVVPCLLYSYDEVDVWSLRENYEVNAALVIQRALAGDIYPYKTAKHRFPDGADVRCSFTLDELAKGAS